MQDLIYHVHPNKHPWGSVLPFLKGGGGGGGLLKSMDIPPCFSAIFTERNNFHASCLCPWIMKLFLHDVYSL